MVKVLLVVRYFSLWPLSKVLAPGAKNGKVGPFGLGNILGEISGNGDFKGGGREEG